MMRSLRCWSGTRASSLAVAMSVEPREARDGDFEPAGQDREGGHPGTEVAVAGDLDGGGGRWRPRAVSAVRDSRSRMPADVAHDARPVADQSEFGEAVLDGLVVGDGEGGVGEGDGEGIEFGGLVDPGATARGGDHLRRSGARACGSGSRRMGWRGGAVVGRADGRRDGERPMEQSQSIASRPIPVGGLGNPPWGMDHPMDGEKRGKCPAAQATGGTTQERPTLTFGNEWE